MEKQLENQHNRHPGWLKFESEDSDYFRYIDLLESMNVPTRDLVFQFPVFVGQVNLARYLYFYDLYKQVNSLNGHLADVGTFKGSSFLFMAKLLKLFEPYNTSQVHGFDWFQGMTPGTNDDQEQNNCYRADYETLQQLIKFQMLNDVAILHKMDITTELSSFMEYNPHLRFKMIFIDCGLEKVLDAALSEFWPRLVQGGILVMDHFNCEVSPTESRLVEKYIGRNRVLQIPFCRQPTAYIVKEF
jgi:hypothetical protein